MKKIQKQIPAVTAKDVSSKNRRKMMPANKAKDVKGSLRKLIHHLKKHKFSITVVWILAIISTVFTIFGPRVLALATDEIVEGIIAQAAGKGGIHFDKIATILLWMAGLYLISAFFSYLQSYMMAGVTAKVTKQLRNELNKKIHRLPPRYFDTVSTGDMISRMTNDVDTINQTLNQSLTQMVTSVTSLIGIVVMMFSISWQMTLVALCLLPLSMFFLALVISKSQKYFRIQQQSLGKVNGHVEEIFSNHLLVKAFNGEKEASETFSTHNDALYDSAWKASFLSSLMTPIMNVINNLGYVVICILGGAFAVNGKLTIGGIQAFIQYMRQFNQPISQITQISNVLQQTAAAAERVFEFLEEQEEMDDSTTALRIQHSNDDNDERLISIKGHIEFDHVTFGYQPAKPVLRNFCAKIKPGQKIAIVGPTGAGKSTIVKLLMRFYDVDKGAITIDGHNINAFDRDDFLGLFGMVLQDTWLFNGSILDNIRYGNLKASDEDVIAAAKAAQVDHVVSTLPDGYQMILNEEADNISEGQRQLLTIARAIIADPEILILDEATSSVDTRTELLIQKAMDNLMQGRTSFIIAHRLSTIRHADLILVLQDGDIIEQGTHEDLLKKNGFYAELYKSQFAAS